MGILLVDDLVHLSLETAVSWVEEEGEAGLPLIQLLPQRHLAQQQTVEHRLTCLLLEDGEVGVVLVQDGQNTCPAAEIVLNCIGIINEPLH